MPWFVPIPADPDNGLAKDSGTDAFQVKSLSLQRFGRRIGVVSPEQVDAVAAAVSLCVGGP